jgi:hypothetical protein
LSFGLKGLNFGLVGLGCNLGSDLGCGLVGLGYGLDSGLVGLSFFLKESKKKNVYINIKNICVCQYVYM